MKLDEIMAAFAAETGAGEFAAGGDGVYHLEVDEMPVTFREDGETGRLVTRGEVARVPEEDRERLSRILMESMYLWAGTGGASFAVDPGTDRLLLQRTDSLKALDVGGFKAMLEAFANELASWREMVEGVCAVGETLETVRAEERDLTRQTRLGLSEWMTV